VPYTALTLGRQTDNENLYRASMLQKTSNVLCELVDGEQNGF